VLRAWTDAKEFALWFHPSADHTTIISQLDVKVGGKYSLEMHNKNGNVFKMSGTYQQIKPPEKLAFTWRWNTAPPETETLVVLEFLDLGNATEIVLSHGQFPDPASRDQHNQGWAGCLERLQNYLA